jgi:hypothetical protein
MFLVKIYIIFMIVTIDYSLALKVMQYINFIPSIMFIGYY